jgi:hypothetical protein
MLAEVGSMLCAACALVAMVFPFDLSGHAGAGFSVLGMVWLSWCCRASVGGVFFLGRV